MKKPTNEEILERCEKEFELAKEYWTPHHNRFTKIKRFVRCHGEYGQWEAQTYRARAGANPPRLTLSENLLGPFVFQEANTLKQSDFGALILPRDGETDPELAKVRQGLHRGIQQIGGWKSALDQAIEDLVDGGLGAWRMVTTYADPMSFQKEFKYMEMDPTRLFHGNGTHRKADFSDVMDSWIYEPYSKQRFKAEFDKDPDEFLNAVGMSEVWGTGKTPWVLEYFFIQEEPATLVMYGDKEMLLADFKELVKDDAAAQGLKPEDLITRDKDGDPIKRETTTRQIWWSKLAGREVLSCEAWPGYYIPNFVATGRKVMVDGEVSYYGLAEPAVDVQRAHNYAFSAMVERAGLAPKVRIFAALESIPPAFQNVWDNLNTTDKMVAYYNAYDSEGQSLPTPHQEPPIQSDPAFANLRAMTSQGIRDVLGMWETSLGAQSNEKSGIAIQTRERQSDTGNYDWGSHLAIACEHSFRVTDELINKVIDVPTQVRIVGEDEKAKVIWAASLEKDAENPENYFDLNQGKFDIICKMAPGADSARLEQTKGMEMLFQGDPEMRSVLAPEYIEIQPWKGAEKMAKIASSYRAMKMPGIDDGKEKEGKQAIPPEVQQQMQQMQQQMQQMQESLQKIGPENQQLKIENQSVKADKANEAQRIEIERFKADTDRMKVQAEIDLKSENMLLEADKAAHSAAMDGAQLEMATHHKVMDHKAQAGMKMMDQDHNMEMAEMSAEPTDAESGNTQTEGDTSGSTMEG